MNYSSWATAAVRACEGFVTGAQVWNGHLLVRLVQILDLFGEDSWRSVYAGALEVRPPGAPTTGPD